MQRVLRIVNDDFSKLQYFTKRGWCIVDISAPGTSGVDSFVYVLIEGPSMEELDFIHKNIDKWGTIKRGPVLVASGIHNQENYDKTNIIHSLDGLQDTNNTETVYNVFTNDIDIDTVNPEGGTIGADAVETINLLNEDFYVLGAGKTMPKKSAEINYTEVSDAIFDPREIILSSYVSPRQHLYNISLLLNQINLQLSYQTSYMMSQTRAFSNIAYTSAQEVAQSTYQTSALNSYLTHMSYLTYLVKAAEGLTTLGNASDNWQYLKNSSNTAVVAEIENLGNTLSDALKDNAKEQAETFTEKMSEFAELLAGDGTTYNQGVIGDVINDLNKALTGIEYDKDGEISFMGAIPVQTESINVLNHTLVYHGIDTVKAINTNTDAIDNLSIKLAGDGETVEEDGILGGALGTLSSNITNKISELDGKLNGVGDNKGTLQTIADSINTNIDELDTNLSKAITDSQTSSDTSLAEIQNSLGVISETLLPKINTDLNSGLNGINSTVAGLATTVTTTNTTLTETKTTIGNIASDITTITANTGDTKNTVNTISEQIKNIDLNPDFYNVTVTSNNTAFGAVSGGGQYLTGTTITLIASPHEGYKFDNWSDNNTDAVREYTVSNENATFTATFSVIERSQYTVTVSSDNSSMGTVSGNNQTGYSGDYMVVTATPTSRHRFLGWYSNETSVSTAPTYVFALTSNVTLVAKFEVDSTIHKTYTVTPSVSGGNGSTGGSKTALENGDAVITTTPNSGYEINTATASPSNCTVTISGNNVICSNVTADVTITITFKVKESSGSDTGGGEIGADIKLYNYLQLSTNNVYFETDYKANANTVITTSCLISSQQSPGAAGILGFRLSSSDKNAWFISWQPKNSTTTTQGRWYGGTGAGSKFSSTTYHTRGNLTTISMDMSSAKFTESTGDVYTINFTTTTRGTTDQPIIIGSFKDNTTVYPYIGTLGVTTIYENDTKMHEYWPCKYGSSIGLYDVITKPSNIITSKGSNATVNESDYHSTLTV